MWILARVAVLASLLVGPPPAAAHVVVEPRESTAGDWERYAVLVPNERASPTVRVELRLPLGMEVVALEAKQGWDGAYHPFPAGAARVGWQGGKIAHGTFLSFEFLAWNPPAARTVSWVATQWYEDGTSDRWEGPEYGAQTVLIEGDVPPPSGALRHFGVVPRGAPRPGDPSKPASGTGRPPGPDGPEPSGGGDGG